MVAQFLASELDCEVALIGIQPQETAFGASLSPPVQRAVRTVTRGLTALLVTEAAFEPPSPASAAPHPIATPRAAAIPD
jgi:hypothetical protein